MQRPLEASVNRNESKRHPGFTIVELLIVIVIIGILATIVIVAYNGITTKARQVTLQSDLSNSRTKMELANATNGHYPAVATVNANPSDYIAASKGNSLSYHTNPNQDTYCISAIGSDNINYVISNLTGPFTGSCAGTDNVIATAGSGVAPATPTNLTATANNSTIQLTWNSVSGADSYELQWRQGTTGSFTSLPVGAVTSYDHTGRAYSSTYQYQVRALSGALQSNWSTIASATTPIPPIGDGSYIQDITSANCPAGKVRAVDARDNHTYWVQKLADGKCWMLTNLGYAGGGTNTYSDVIPTGAGTAGTLSGPDNAGASTYTLAKYYIPTGANVTTEPTAPSTSTNGTGQYGYLYNWCAAMGAQATAACANAATPAPVTTTSICPSGWRLPVGNGAEFTALNNAVNSGSTSSDSGLINAPWLGQRSGGWNSGFNNQGINGYYWSSTQYPAAYGYYLYLNASNVGSAGSFDKYRGFAVRCVAAV